MELQDQQKASDLGEQRACAVVGGLEGNVFPWECVQGLAGATCVRMGGWHWNLCEGDIMPSSDF